MSFPTSIRLPEDVRRSLRKIAKQEGRELSPLIIHILRLWLKAREPITGQEGK